MTAFNQSRVKMFRRCQKQYSFRYDYAHMLDGTDGQELVPRVSTTSLHKGTWLHALQEAHHRALAVEDGFDPEVVYPDGNIELWSDVHTRFKEEFDGLFEEEREDLGAELPSECLRLFRAYLKRWKDDNLRYRTARLHSGEPAIEFVVSAKLPSRTTEADEFKGRIDRVVEDLEYGGLWIWDAKWVKRVPDSDERMMSPQAVMYLWAMVMDDYDMRGFVFNYGRTKAPAIPQTLRRGTLSMRQRMDTDYSTYLQAIRDLHGKEWKDWAALVYLDKLRDLQGREQLWFRRERIPVEAERIEVALAEYMTTVEQINARPLEDIPRSYFYNCRFGCAYHDPCVAEFQGLDIQPLIQSKYTLTEERYGNEEETIDLLSDS